MARIAREEIERLKSTVKVEDLARAAGLVLEPEGGNLRGLCPLHEEVDGERALIIRPSTNTWECRSGCQSGGSSIDWLMRTEHVAFRHAVELLRAHVAGNAPAGEIEPIFTGEAPDGEVLGQVLGYYHETLKASTEALDFWRKRGLCDGDAVTRFQLGYSDRTLGFRVPSRDSRAGQALRVQLARLGIVRESGHEQFRGSVVVPIRDEDGQVVEVYGRKTTSNLRSGTALHTWLHAEPRGVFNAAALGASREVILCQSVIDALVTWSAGFRAVTAVYGLDASPAAQLEAFARHGTERVLIAFRRDELGDAAATALAERLTAQGIESFRVQLPRGMDVSDYASKVQPAPRSLELVLRSATWLGKGRTASAPLASIAAPSAPLAPTPVAPAPAPNAPTTPAGASSEDLVLELGDRRYRIRGLERNKGPEQLRVNLHATRNECFYVDTVDLYQARQRAGFERQAAQDLGLGEDDVKRDLGRLLLHLEEVQDARRKKPDPATNQQPMSQDEIDAAMALLRDPHLADRILDDFERCGVIGEHKNKLLGYLVATSRKLDQPLAAIVQSSSAAGKTALMEAVLAFMPAEDCVQYSAMTGQSLFYMGEQDLRHKVLAIAEEEGARRASYALKLLQSEGELTIATTIKDAVTGNLVTKQCHVEGPVSMLTTTTAIDIDEELLNRCLVLPVSEDREQTRAILVQQRQAETVEGLVARKRREKVLALHRNAQRLLRPVAVVNPFAPELRFTDGRTRARRDHKKYLVLIRAIALLHQHQRPLCVAEVDGDRVEYIEATRDDITLADRLMVEVLGRSLDDMPPQTRRFLDLLGTWVEQACAALRMQRIDFRFSRRDVRAVTKLSQEQVRVHLERLVELEYVHVHRGQMGQSFVYELAAAGPTTIANLPDLPDSEVYLPATYRGGTGRVPEGHRTSDLHESIETMASDRDLPVSMPKTQIRAPRGPKSYVNGSAAAGSR